MEFSNSLDVIGPVLQICLIDLLLSGDNAILIAMACADLPAAIRGKAVILGTAVAVLFRVLLAFAATLALRAPYIKLFGAVLLVLIAIELVASNSTGHKRAAARDPNAGIWKAIMLIVVADAVMSLDNVVAVAAAAQDNLGFLLLGLLLSVPILVASSLLITRLLTTNPLLIEAGGALLGWVAGKTAVSDPAIAATLQAQSFGLVALAPLLGAAYVVVQGRLLRNQRDEAQAAEEAPRAVPSGGAPHPQDLAFAGAARATDTPGASGPMRLPTPHGTPDSPANAAVGAPVNAPGVRRFSKMDLMIMGGVAVPLLGLLAMLFYMVGRAVFSK